MTRISHSSREAAGLFGGLPYFIVSCILLFGWGANADAQTVQLTPAQQQMINQLPANQRQQALDAIRQINEQGALPGTEQPGLADDTAALPRPAETSAEMLPAAEAIAVAAPGSLLIVNLLPKFELPDEDIEMLDSDPALLRVSGSHYYELDENGVLRLPGLPSVPLLGLTAPSIAERLGAEPALRFFDIKVSILDGISIGASALEPYGYEVFESIDGGLQPATTGPVPPNYVLGPGDNLRVQMFGNLNAVYELEVSRDGILNLPQLGPITVAGMPFSAFRADLDRRVRESLVGTQVSTTMGELRTMQVFVLGDVNRPGSYVVSSMATISSALYYSGGISRIGSLRDVQLKRQGSLVTSLDLYDLLLSGDTSGDQRLQPGDVIFVPPVGRTVGITGAVRRPAIYEMNGDGNVAEIIRLAGGLLAIAFPKAAHIERINDAKERVVIAVDADSPEAAATTVRSGDVIKVPEVLRELNETVILAGHVQRPGPYQWRRGMRLTDLLPSALDLNPGADADYVVIRRVDDRSRRVFVLSAQLSQAWIAPGSGEDIELQARDTVHVFSLAYGRQRIIEPILEELQLQSRFGEPFSQVRIGGEVKAPGTYPLEPGMRISDLIRAGGNLSEEAYTLSAELTRYSIVDSEVRSTNVIDVDLGALLRGDNAADTVLAAHDHVNISKIAEWDSEWTINLEGEVRFPGEYRIRRGETLGEALVRAGGLTDEAFPAGSIFLRQSLKEREQQQIDLLTRRLETDLASLSLQSVDTTGAETLSTGQALLDQLRETEAVGRLVIDLEQLTARTRQGEAINDVQLHDGDRLLVPTHSQVVTVIGEVQQSTSHLYQDGLTRDDYIDMSGGVTRRADKKHIYVVRASGAVLAGNKSRWFGNRGGIEIRPGDTIVAPLEVDRIRPLTFWTNVTQILYQGAIAVAAVTTFDR